MNVPPQTRANSMQSAWAPITPNIAITDHHLAAFGVVTDLRGTEWSSTGSGTAQRSTPSWAIVMCVLLIWLCFIGLLFLAIKEERFVGEVTVTVRTAAGQARTESVPVTTTFERDQVLARVAWAQGVTARA